MGGDFHVFVFLMQRGCNWSSTTQMCIVFPPPS